MRGAIALAVLLLSAPALAEPTEVVVPAGTTISMQDRAGRAIRLEFSEDHLLISRTTADELLADKRLAASLEQQYRACEAARARDASAAAERPDPGWSAWRWGAVGAVVAGALAGGIWIGSR